MAILKCGYCGARTSDTSGTCEKCGHEIDDSFGWVGGVRTQAADRVVVADVEAQSTGLERTRSLPGETANVVLQVVAAIELLITLLGSIIIAAQLKTGLAWVVAVGVAVQGVVTSALLFAFAALGENLVAVRRRLERAEGAHAFRAT